MPLPATWSSKDPDETVQYQLPWADQLDSGDTIATSVWLDVTGVTLDADSVADDELSTYAMVSDGTDGTTATLINRVTTANGETLEQAVSLPIVATVSVPLGEYETPRPIDLVTRYPAFADVSYDTIAVHINDALGGVDTSWMAADYAPAIMALAAHNMTIVGIGTVSEARGYAREGVTSLRDGAFAVSFSEKAVNEACGAGLNSTLYGRFYQTLLRRNKAGPRLAGGGVSPSGWGPTALQNNGAILPWSDY